MSLTIEEGFQELFETIPGSAVPPASSGDLPHEQGAVILRFPSERTTIVGTLNAGQLIWLRSDSELLFHKKRERDEHHLRRIFFQVERGIAREVRNLWWERAR